MSILVLFAAIALVTADLQSVVSLQTTGSGTFSVVCAGSPLTFEMATVADIEVWSGCIDDFRTFTALLATSLSLFPFLTSLPPSVRRRVRGLLLVDFLHDCFAW